VVPHDSKIDLPLVNHPYFPATNVCSYIPQGLHELPTIQFYAAPNAPVPTLLSKTSKSWRRSCYSIAQIVCGSQIRAMLVSYISSYFITLFWSSYAVVRRCRWYIIYVVDQHIQQTMVILRHSTLVNDGESWCKWPYL